MLEALGVGGIQNTHPGEVEINLSDESWADIDGMHQLLILISGISAAQIFSFFLSPQTTCTIKRRYKNTFFMQVNIPPVVFEISLQSKLSA